jgi:hypothetical protein
MEINVPVDAGAFFRQISKFTFTEIHPIKTLVHIEKKNLDSFVGKSNNNN